MINIFHIKRIAILFIFVYCLFSFKWTIIDTGSSGIRVDDFFCLFVFIFWVKTLFYENKVFTAGVKKINLCFFVFLFFCLFSSFYNSYLGRVPFFQSVLFSIRPFEYWVFYLVGFQFYKYNISIKSIFFVYLLYVISLVILQYFGIVGVVSSFGGTRAIANTGGPWEFAAVSAFLFLYFMLGFERVKSILSFILLVLSSSRITLVGALISFFMYFRKTLNKFNLNFFLFSFAGIFFLFFMFLFYLFLSPQGFNLDNIQVISRFSVFFTSDTLSNIENIFYSMPSFPTSDEYIAYTYSDDSLFNIFSMGGDASALIRFSRWITLLKSFLLSSDTIFIGLGPSFAGLAVDGYYVRVLIECGVLGLISFAFFVFYALSIFKKQREYLLFFYLLTLVITGLFIDIFTTYKAMMLFWFVFGYQCGKKRNLNVPFNNESKVF